jgi:hypothetical protein
MSVYTREWRQSDVDLANQLKDVTSAAGAVTTNTSRAWTSTTFSPSATANTNGAAQVVNGTSATGRGFAALNGLAVTFGGTFGAETATMTVTATFSDATTASATVTATATGVVNATLAQLIALHKDAVFIKSLSLTLKSSIASSTANCTVQLLATQV